MFTRRSRRITAAVTLAVTVTVAVVLAITMSGTSTRPAAHAQASHCPPTAPGTSVPTAPPPDLRWKSIGPVLVPTSATEGPASYHGPIWTCYAHTPMGAVLAAYDIFAGLASPDWRTVADNEVVPGQGQQAFIQAGEKQTYQAPAPGEIAPAVGFEVVSYTPQQATIEVLADAGENYQADERTVTWTDGDWKMVLTPDGTSGPDTQLVTSADGFVLWGSAANG
jgi:hypothetical protein